MKRIILAFALLVLALLPSSYSMPSHEGHDMGKCHAGTHSSSVFHNGSKCHLNCFFEHDSLKIVMTSKGIVAYFKGKFLFSVSFPQNSSVETSFFGSSFVLSSQDETIIVNRYPLTVNLYFKSSGRFKVSFVNLREKNPGYYVFGLENVRGVLILLRSYYSNGVICGNAGSSAMISVMWGKPLGIPLGIMMKIRAQILIQEKEKGEIRVNVCCGSNFSASEVKITSFGIQLSINKTLSGLIEVSMPHNLSQGSVLVMYNGFPAWRAEAPQDLNYSEESFWTSNSDNSTLVYLKVPGGGTICIVPHGKLIELKVLGIGIGSAVSACLLFVLFRRL